MSSPTLDAAKCLDTNTATSLKLPRGIKRQPGGPGCVSKGSAPWACAAAAEDQRSGREDANEQRGDNWVMRKNKGRCGRERGGQTQKAEKILAFSGCTGG